MFRCSGGTSSGGTSSGGTSSGGTSSGDHSGGNCPRVGTQQVVSRGQAPGPGFPGGVPCGQVRGDRVLGDQVLAIRSPGGAVAGGQTPRGGVKSWGWPSLERIPGASAGASAGAAAGRAQIPSSYIRVEVLLLQPSLSGPQQPSGCCGSSSWGPWRVRGGFVAGALSRVVLLWAVLYRWERLGN
jgi:hypothetical protein